MATAALHTKSLPRPTSHVDHHNTLLRKTFAVLHKLAFAYAAEKEPHTTYIDLIAHETLIALSLMEPQRATLVTLGNRLGIHRFQLHESLLQLIEKRLVQVKGAEFRLTLKGTDLASAEETMVHAIMRRLDRLDQHTLEDLYALSVRMIREKQLCHSINPSQLCVACTSFQPFTDPSNPAPHHCALTEQRFAGPPLIQISKRTASPTSAKTRRSSLC